jgi:hypothetical protein
VPPQVASRETAATTKTGVKQSRTRDGARILGQRVTGNVNRKRVKPNSRESFWKTDNQEWLSDLRDATHLSALDRRHSGYV